jgi:regulator of protease activity HflC (stomatin/prohibitin superfamily)
VARLLSRAKLNRLSWRTRHYIRHHILEFSVGALILLFLVVYFSGSMFYTIPPGSVGVLFERFTGGTQLGPPLPEGFRIIMPWNKIYIYDTRVQLRAENLDVLSVDGLSLQINIAYQFELIPKNVPKLHEFVGPDYITVMIDPDIAARARDIFSKNTPQQIYSDRRTDIQKQILDAVNDHLHDNFNPPDGERVDYVKIEDVLVRSIKLPPAVAAAIDSKNEQQQLNQEYDYRILREAKESRRKLIEAQGIEAFQDTVSRGITEGYLRWRGIEATLELAKSPNSKVVIIGGGRSGLPIILGGDEGSSSVSSSATPGPIAAAPPASDAKPEPPLPPLTALLRQLGLASQPAPATPEPISAGGGQPPSGSAPGLAPQPQAAAPANSARR